MTPDAINACFETLGCLMIINNIKTLHQDKQVKGVSVVSTTFFGVWGFWNLYYYPHLDQSLSFYAGLGIVIF